MIKTISAVDAAGGGSFYGYTIKTRTVWSLNQLKACFYTQIFKQIKLKPGESVTGKTFATRKCLTFPDKGEIKKALTTLSTNNYDLLRNSMPKNFHFTPVIYSPIPLKDYFIGITTSDSFQLSLHFKQEDICFLGAICHQAAVALEKSSFYREKEKTIRKAFPSYYYTQEFSKSCFTGGRAPFNHYVYTLNSWSTPSAV